MSAATEKVAAAGFALAIAAILILAIVGLLALAFIAGSRWT